MKFKLIILHLILLNAFLLEAEVSYNLFVGVSPEMEQDGILIDFFPNESLVSVRNPKNNQIEVLKVVGRPSSSGQFVFLNPGVISRLGLSSGSRVVVSLNKFKNISEAPSSPVIETSPPARSNENRDLFIPPINTIASEAERNPASIKVSTDDGSSLDIPLPAAGEARNPETGPPSEPNPTGTYRDSDPFTSLDDRDYDEAFTPLGDRPYDDRISASEATSDDPGAAISDPPALSAESINGNDLVSKTDLAEQAELRPTQKLPPTTKTYFLKESDFRPPPESVLLSREEHSRRAAPNTLSPASNSTIAKESKELDPSRELGSTYKVPADGSGIQAEKRNSETLVPKYQRSALNVHLPKGLYIQVAAFRESSNARRLVKSLAQDFTVNMLSAKLNNGDIYRCAVGTISESQLAATLQNLRTKGFKDAFVFEVDN